MERIKIFILGSIAFFCTLSCGKSADEDEYISNLPPTNKICFVGNSLTYWGNWITLTSDSLCKNYGIGGNTCKDILNRISPIVDENPCAIFLMIGINDIRRNDNAQKIEQNIALIIKKFKHRLPHTSIYLQSILPVNPDISDIVSIANISKIKEINNWLADFSKKESITYINLYPHFCNKDDKLKPELSTEGLHLSEKGYETWAVCLKPYLRKIREEYPF
ncbi:MAG: sialate O-acetylesterase [Bacteroidaceae bacterium]|nr:sialate O-acetylesterase [Bacteroidaceae bacterium]